MNAKERFYQTLKNLLSEDEYAAARASTLNAHYTSQIIEIVNNFRVRGTKLALPPGQNALIGPLSLWIILLFIVHFGHLR